MNTPNNQKSTDAAKGTASILKNKFTSSGKLQLILASDGTGSNGNANILIFPGWAPSNPTMACKLPDGQHITLAAPKISGTVSEVLAYLQNVKMHVTKITINTTDTDNWNGGNQLTIGKVSPDGRVPEITDIPFDPYTRMSGSNVSDSVTIDDVDFTTGGNFYMSVQKIKLSSTMTFTFEISGTNDNALITPRD